MKATALIAQVIMAEEGLSLTPYRDGAGYMTIGYGHLLPIDCPVPEKIGLPEATSWLTEDIQEAEDAVNRQVKVPLTQEQFDSLVSFTFNFGEDKLKNSGLLRELNAGHYGEVPKRLMLWSKVKQKDGSLKVSNGLLNRRKREVNIWERGDYSDPRAQL
jgi:lysozyme